MRIYGLDFTSAPSSRTSKAKKLKRLMLVVCTLKNRVLKIDEFQLLNGDKAGDFSPFEAWFETAGPWIAGIDFPFGHPPC